MEGLPLVSVFINFADSALVVIVFTIDEL